MAEEYIPIAEYARRVGVSRQAIYKRLDKDLKPYVREVDGKKVLVSSIFGDRSGKLADAGKTTGVDGFVDGLQGEIDALREQVRELRETVKEKDRLLAEYTARFAELAVQAQTLAAQAQTLHAADKRLPVPGGGTGAEDAVERPRSLWRRLLGRSMRKGKER